jgi:hypothetical protein
MEDKKPVTRHAWFRIVQTYVDGHYVSVKSCPVRERSVR